MEYLILRLLRRFVIRGGLLRFVQNVIPYYDPSQNENDPEPIIQSYLKYLKLKNKKLTGLNVLDIGSGSTNSIGYGFIRHGVKSVTLFEPYAKFDQKVDAAIKAKTGLNAISNLTRVTDLKSCSKKFDLIVSNSVLEHVQNPRELFEQLQALLATNGVMLHIVDFRDHFFKYPYNFLKYGRSIWNLLLNPGDLPRWRKYDYTRLFQSLNYEFEVLDETSDLDEFNKIKSKLSSDFELGNPDLPITFCTFYINKASDG